MRQFGPDCFRAPQMYRPCRHPGGERRRVEGQAVALEFEAAFSGGVRGAGVEAEVEVEGVDVTGGIHLISGAINNTEWWNILRSSVSVGLAPAQPGGSVSLNSVHIRPEGS